MRRMLALAALAAACAAFAVPATAQPPKPPAPQATNMVAINGRDTAPVGTLVVFTGTVPGGRYTWVYDREYGDTLQCRENKTLAFVPARPGRYVFWLVAETGDTLTAVRHTLTATDKTPATPTQPPADGDQGGLTKQAAATAKRYAAIAAELNDPATEAALKARWLAALPAIRGAADLDAAGDVAGAAFEEAMRGRRGLSRYVDWLGRFRRPLNADIEKLAKGGVVKTPADLATVLQAVAAALR